MDRVKDWMPDTAGETINSAFDRMRERTILEKEKWEALGSAIQGAAEKARVSVDHHIIFDNPVAVGFAAGLAAGIGFYLISWVANRLTKPTKPEEPK